MSRYLAISAILAVRLAVAGEAPQEGPLSADAVPLGDADLRAIRLQLVEKNPLLASSPGIKAAFTYRGPGTTIEFAHIVFYPHAESGGIKYAFRGQCRRENPDESWACEYVGPRRYVKLESQDFELRVSGDLDIETVQALVRATRVTAQANAPVGAVIPRAAIIIVPVGHGYMVGWGSAQGYQTMSVEANLRKGGNPAVSEDWQTEVLQPEE
jgi:hypothetical protein